jgi:hypothetical protein
MLLRAAIIVLFQCGVVAPAWAASCTTSLNGELRLIDYTTSQQDLIDTDQFVADQFVPKKEMKGNTTVRERLLGRWGKVDCPAYLTLREFTPDLTDETRKPFCLIYDKAGDTYTGFSEGDRNAYLICKNPKTFCERVNTTKDEARNYARTGLDVARRTALSPDVGAILTHSSGAMILKGSGSYISGALGASGTTLGAVLSAPAVVAAGAVTVVGVGGAVYFCR